MVLDWSFYFLLLRSVCPTLVKKEERSKVLMWHLCIYTFPCNKTASSIFWTITVAGGHSRQEKCPKAAQPRFTPHCSQELLKCPWARLWMASSYMSPAVLLTLHSALLRGRGKPNRDALFGKYKGDQGCLYHCQFDQSEMNDGGVINILHACFPLKPAGKVPSSKKYSETT